MSRYMTLKTEESRFNHIQAIMWYTSFLRPKLFDIYWFAAIRNADGSPGVFISSMTTLELIREKNHSSAVTLVAVKFIANYLF